MSARGLRFAAALLVGLLAAGCTAPGAPISRATVDDANATTNDTAADATSPTPATVDLPLEGSAGTNDTPPAPGPAPAPAPDASPEPAPQASPEPVANATNETPAAPDNVTLPAPGNDTPVANDTPPTPTPAPPTPPPPATIALSAVSASAQRIEAGGPGVVVRGLVLAPDPARVASVGARASLAGAQDIIALHLVAADDLARASEPATFGPDGCRAWRPGNGTLGFACALAPPRGSPRGAYSLVASATDDAGASVASDPLPLDVAPLRRVQAAPTPVGADGNASAIPGWGGWAARPGARSVAATNYIKLANAGDDPNATVVVDFGTDGFRGSLDPRFAIPTVGNLEFAWWEEKGNVARAAPGHGRFTWHVSAGGTSETVRFSSTDGVIFLAYRIKAMPAVLPVQPYVASYTVTEA